MTTETPLRYRTPAADEFEPLLHALWQSLHLSFLKEEPLHWGRRLGIDTFRAVYRHDRVAGGLRVIPMAQWFGGAAVRTAGIAAVGILPEFRGEGVATFLLRSMLEEARTAGYPLSLLFPATIPIYRHAGYELAGSRIVYELPTATIDVKARSLQMVRVGDGANEEITHLYRLRARWSDGNLDRPPFIWDRVLKPRAGAALKYLIRRGDESEGYVIYTQGGQHEPLHATDICVLTPEAGRRLLAFFADHRSMAEQVFWPGGPGDPLAHLLPEATARISRSTDWMLRIVDVERALSLRGYPASLQATLSLQVDDPLLSWNNGRFVLTVEGGRGTVSRGGEGLLHISARGLAALYTGFLSPRELHALGLLVIGDAELATAGLLFSGPRPWQPDMF